MPRNSVFAVVVTLVCCVASTAQPTVLDPGVTIRALVDVPAMAVRLVDDPLSTDLFMLQSSGNIYRINVLNRTRSLIYDSSDHGLGGSNVLGMATGPDGSIYVVNNESTATENVARIMRGIPGNTDGQREWSLFAETESYPRSGTAFDHNVNGVVVSPDGEYLFVNSGSRTDHGEIQDGNGTFPGLREVPLTSAIFRLPIDAPAPHLLQNDEDSLEAYGYLFADGTRNSFDLAFLSDAELFATENSGDRDDGDELNWIREGHHYGFPWRMGGNDTPMQFPGYDPSADKLLNPAGTAIQGGFFYDDPSYPPPPEETTFTDGLINLGPDAALYRDADSGGIVNAADEAEFTLTFTPHRSPLGLVFDTAAVLMPPYKGDGFMLSWTDIGSGLLSPFGDPAEDLLFLHILRTADSEQTPVGVTATKLVTGLSNPIDAVLRGNKLFLLEMVFGGTGTLWELTLPTESGLDTEDELEAQRFLWIDSVFPNPTQQSVSLSVTTRRPGLATVELLDVAGRRVGKPEKRVLTDGSQQFSADVSQLSAGLYFVRVTIDSDIAFSSFSIVR